MTFDEMEQYLPNGFHDAEVNSLTVDYVAGTVVMKMNLWVGTHGASDPDEYKPAVIEISGLHFMAIDPPDPKYPFVPDGSPITVSGDPAKSDTLPALESLLPTFPAGVKCHRFFVQEWNSFIYIAAKDVGVAWLRVD